MSVFTISDDIRQSSEGRKIAYRLHRIYEHSIVPEVKASLQAELSALSYARIKNRIPDVNVVRQLTNKLAKVYDKDASRKCSDPTDQKLVDYYSNAMVLDLKMRTANVLVELTKSCALEPYMSAEGPRIRVLAPYQFKAHSDDPNDPTRMTAFTKFLPNDIEEIETYDESKKLVKKFVEVQVFRTYTPETIETWSWDGSEKRVRESIENPIGLIPVVLANPSEFEITPEPPESDIESAVLIPKTYADLFYALKFSCHSITIAMDCQIPENAAWAPDSFIEAKTDDLEAGKQGKIEIVKPEADIEEGLSLIRDTLISILESRGIKPPQTNVRLERPNASAAMIESADASSHIMKRCSFFLTVESALWKLISKLHNEVWSKDASNALTERSAFTDKLKVEVQFGEIKPVEIRAELLDRLDKQLKLGLMSRKQALQELYPNFTDAQLEDWLKKAGDDSEVLREAAQTLVPKSAATSGSGNNSTDTSQNVERNGPQR